MSSESSREKILEAALALLTRRGHAEVTMAEIAKAARLSRQAVYLHFTDRAALLLALIRYSDEKLGLQDEIRKIVNAPSGVAAMRKMVSLQARLNPKIWAVALAFESVRRHDPAAERSWQDRLQHRLEGCRQIVERVQREGNLRPGLSLPVATDLLWSLTSLRTWEDLVLQRGWSAGQYEERMNATLMLTLTTEPKSQSS